MRDFRDAKAMAQTLRDALKVKSISVSTRLETILGWLREGSPTKAS